MSYKILKEDGDVLLKEDGDALLQEYTGIVVVPTAITQVASNIEATTARINGKITDDGGESCEARFRWKKTSG